MLFAASCRLPQGKPTVWLEPIGHQNDRHSWISPHGRSLVNLQLVSRPLVPNTDLQGGPPSGRIQEPIGQRWSTLDLLTRVSDLDMTSFGGW